MSNSPKTVSSNNDTKKVADDIKHLDLSNRSGSPKKAESPQHRFWDTQPVTKSKETKIKNGPIDAKNDSQSIPLKPFKLPNKYYWDTFDISNEEEINEFFELLQQNYIEDEDHSFRFRYEKDFLKWALSPPGFEKDLHVCVRTSPSGEMVASITGIPVTAFAEKKKLKMVEINFLCVHKKLRSKRLAPVLIKEITRRVHLKGIWQAIYTAGIEVTKPFCKNLYYHRQLNPRKLVEIQFAYKNPKLKMELFEKLHRLPAKTSISLEPLKEEDSESAMKLLNDYLQKFKMRFYFSEKEFSHFFVPRENVVSTYVKKDGFGNVTDIASFYILSSTVLNHSKHKELKAAYSFYNVATTTSKTDLMKCALILAKKNKCDVYNALDLMENKTTFEDLRFNKGDGTLNYYLYNWALPSIESSENSLILF